MRIVTESICTYVKVAPNGVETPGKAVSNVKLNNKVVVFSDRFNEREDTKTPSETITGKTGTVLKTNVKHFKTFQSDSGEVVKMQLDLLVIFPNKDRYYISSLDVKQANNPGWNKHLNR